MRFEQAVVRIHIEVHGNGVLQRGGKFFLEVFDELRDPAGTVVVVTVGNKDVVLVSGYQRGHLVVGGEAPSAARLR